MSTAKDHFSSTRAKDVMTRDVFTIFANQQMSKAGQELLDRRITGAPVVSYEGRCVGVLSTKDVLKQSQRDSGADPVSVHMTSPAITVSESHSLMDVAAILRSSRIHRAPLVDDHGRIVGILSISDMVDQILKTMELEN